MIPLAGLPLQEPHNTSFLRLLPDTGCPHTGQEDAWIRHPTRDALTCPRCKVLIEFDTDGAHVRLEAP